MKTLSWVLIGVILLLFSFAVARSDDNSLIKQLGSYKYSEREKASKELACIMTFKRYTEFRNLKHADIEIARRVQFLVAGYEQKISDGWVKNFRKALPKETMHYPWIYLGGVSWDHRCYYVKSARLMGTPDDGLPHCTDWRMATRLWLDSELGQVISLAMKESKSKEEFFLKADSQRIRIMHAIGKMVQMQDNYYGGREKNPLRKIWNIGY